MLGVSLVWVKRCQNLRRFLFLKFWMIVTRVLLDARADPNRKDAFGTLGFVTFFP